MLRPFTYPIQVPRRRNAVHADQLPERAAGDSDRLREFLLPAMNAQLAADGLPESF
jgi:hypothetical protein